MTTRAHDTVSLLSQRYRDFLDLIAPQWQFRLLKNQTTATLESLQALAACNISTLGDLSTVTPLMLLALGAKVAGPPAEGTPFWEHLLQQERDAIKPLLQTILIEQINTALSQPQKPAPHQPTEIKTGSTEGETGYSSLLIQPGEVIDQWTYPDSITIVNWPHGVKRRVAFAPGEICATPLLAAPVRDALRAAGCDLRAVPLSVLPLSVRTANACTRARLTTLEALTSQTPEQLMTLRNFGSHALEDVLHTSRDYLLPRLEAVPPDILVPPEPLHPFVVEQEAPPLPRTALDPAKLIAQPGKTNATLFPDQPPPRQGKNALFFPIDGALQALGRLPAQQHEARLSLSPEDVIWNALLSTRLTEALVEKGCDLEKTGVRQLFFQQGSLFSSLSVRTYNVLVRSGIYMLGTLVRQTPYELMRIHNFGVSCYREVIAALHAYLQPWLDALGIDKADEGSLLAYQDPPPLAFDVPAEPEETITLSDVFAALISPDLFDWLDYYEAPWRQLPIAEACPALSTDERINLQDSLMLGDLTAPEQMTSPELAEQAITEIQQTLVAMLAKHIIGAAPSEQEQENNRQALAPVSIESLLAELLNQYILTRRRSPGRSMNGLPREMVVMLTHSGVLVGQTKTLEELAATFHLTRERIRQLESRAEEALNKGAARPFVEGLTVLVKWATQAEGGVTIVSRAAQRLSGWLPFGNLHPEATIKLLVKWATGKLVKGDARLVTPQPALALLDEIDAHIEHLLKSYSGGLSFPHFVDEIMLAGGEKLFEAGREFVSAALRISDAIEIQGEFCLPRAGGTLKLQLVSVLRNLGKPAHFNEIARRYNALFPDEKPRTGHAVQAILLRFPEIFARTGNGTYALAEAGYEGALTVADALERILQESDRPLHVNEVVAQGKERYQWKESALRAGLLTNPKIISFGYGFFGLGNHNYPGFDAAKSYEVLFDAEPIIKERLVVATYTNQYHHPVVQLKLSENTLQGTIRLSNKPLRDLFQVQGLFKAKGLVPGQPACDLSIKRGQYDIGGLARWFKQNNAQPGDFLFIEKLTDEQAVGDYIFRLAYAPADKLAAAMQLVGLSPTDEAGGALDYRVLWRCREPEKLSGLLTYTLAHPWLAIQAVSIALGFAPASPHGAEYVELGLLGGLLAVGKVEQDAPTEIVRPTPFGRAWIAQQHDADTLAVSLALSLPPYRAHLRSDFHDEQPDDDTDVEQMTTALLDPKLLAVWDARFGLAAPTLRDRTLRESNAVVTTARLPGPVLTLLLLLLAAQSNGLGISLPVAEVGGLANAKEAALRLHQLGIAVQWDASGQAALAEQVHLAVTSSASVEERLRAHNGPLGAALAEGWHTIQQNAWPLHSISAADLYTALMGTHSALFNSLLVPTPEGIDQAVRYVDGWSVPCPFVSLAADWGLVPTAHAPVPFAFLSHATRLIRGQAVEPIAICLNRELLAQDWDVKRMLAANAHLALLTLIASDAGGLAERCSLGEHGYLLADRPLIQALDDFLRGLGYAVWDEGYRQDAAMQAALGRELVALGEQLGLLTVSTNGFESLSPLATEVYYSAYDVLLRLQALFQRLATGR